MCLPYFSYDHRGTEERGRHWADPRAGGRASLHQEDSDTFFLHISNLTRLDQGLYRYTWLEKGLCAYTRPDQRL